jgi:hypothetical protein
MRCGRWSSGRCRVGWTHAARRRCTSEALGPDGTPGLAFEVPAEEEATTGRYLDQATALLVALPVELGGAQPDPGFAGRARDLLSQTRWLLDAPELSDPALQLLLEDLEIVLAQVVRLQADRDPMKLDLLAESLEQRDVLPRLRLAAAHGGTE